MLSPGEAHRVTFVRFPDSAVSSPVAAAALDWLTSGPPGFPSRAFSAQCVHTWADALTVCF